MTKSGVAKHPYRRELDELAQRRRRAMELLEEGVAQSDVAREIGVRRQTVSRWAKLLAEYSDEEAWRRRPIGRPTKFNSEQRMALLRELAGHYDVPSRSRPKKLWSLERVAKLIEERFGVSYSVGHVSTMLNELVGCQWSSSRVFWTKVREVAYPEKRRGRS